MQTWFIILFSISIAFLLKAFINLLFPNKHLPPGPPTFPIIGNLLWLRRSTSQIEPILRNLHAKFGPIVTLHFGSRRAIFVADRSLAYKALVQNGAVFSNRPPAPPTTKLFSSNQHNITSSSYGPTWRLLRRNLNREILHPARVRSYTRARKWVLHILLDRLKSESKNGDPVRVNESQIKHVEDLQRRLLLGFNRFNILNLWPRLTKIVLRKRWEELLQLRKYQEEVLIPLIRSRKKVKEESLNEGKEDEYVIAYVDSLLDLELPEEKRKLNESEVVSLSSEFLNAGTDTTSTALQWIMANLVKYPHIQEKIFMEIKGVVEEGEDEVKEDELQKMPYLKAVILEGLRRHPPAHFVLPHAVTEDVEVNGYVIPKDVSINLMVAEMGWDPKVWEGSNGIQAREICGW
ncbi:hypothetical protein Pint_20904 [Pistacia integerrima]|uniref:Uncharacterized protein n=1 Tax=Pistacia integerrima TaxID=434235 RepID=A0ACC0XDN0_9ROSI|nr:hypothetical protein Pint_20904 [Pistacia integerrima]